jgi:uncharacterized membrane protein
MPAKMLLLKALIWRFFIAIPTGFAITYFFIRDINTSILASITGNIIGTFLYLLYDMLWFKIVPKLIRIDNDSANNSKQ